MNLTAILFLALALTPIAQDSDRDGLADRFEQALLEKFLPQFIISAEECDGFPAEFGSGLSKPEFVTKNGTIYGQVSPAPSGGFIEIHYYHIWSADCGPVNGHELDAEHVSVLLKSAGPAESEGSWKAEYWYAAAHEDTVCDASQAARSSVISADDRGAKVWISAGKHASYLDPKMCRGGCGSDTCDDGTALAVPKIINIGERGSFSNEAAWAGWPGWPLSAKMDSDFPEAVVALIDSEKAGIMRVGNSNAPVKTAVLIGGNTAEALVAADRKTDAAFASANGAVGNSINRSAAGVGHSLKIAARAFWRSIRCLNPE